MNNYKNVLFFTRQRIKELKNYKLNLKSLDLNELNLNLISFNHSNSNPLSNSEYSKLLDSNINILSNFHNAVRKNFIIHRFKSPIATLKEKECELYDICVYISKFEKYNSNINAIEKTHLESYLDKINFNLEQIYKKSFCSKKDFDDTIKCIKNLSSYKATIYDLQKQLQLIILVLNSHKAEMTKNYDLFCCLMFWLNLSNTQNKLSKQIITHSSLPILNEFIINIYKLHFNYELSSIGNIEKTKETIDCLNYILSCFEKILKKDVNYLDFSDINLNLLLKLNELKYSKDIFSPIICKLINTNNLFSINKISSEDYFNFINESKQESTKLANDYNSLYEKQIFYKFSKNLFDTENSMKFSKIFSKSELNFIFSTINTYGLNSLCMIEKNYCSLKKAIN